MNDERRKYRRTKKQIRIEFHKTKLLFLSGPGDSADAVDISSTGARINTRMDLQSGEHVKLLIRRAESEPELGFSGKVVWVKPTEEQGVAFTQAGIEFTNLGLQQRVMLVRLTTGI
jgi:hypothetical protein